MAASLTNLSRRAFQTALLNASAKAEAHGPWRCWASIIITTIIFSAASMKQWKMVSLLVALPSVGLCMVNAFVGHEHEERDEFVAYEHLRLRNKRFPWGEGQKSLFHNSHVNPLPDGYEEH
ncbi:cytochrome c oxidase subunit 6A2, mitochondrial-like [Macrobrachium rosenbergii]|uniref:cytochrome c oxidase subunit 6A2, mitochondrial-like n=1 Tax=Macrobrachium rosenbergii TaxID=79674 RepID=UPI0034D4D43D